MPEKTKLSSVITKRYAGMQLLEFLCGRFKYHSRKEWEEQILNGSVNVNDLTSSPGYVLRIKDIVSYSVVLSEPPVDTNIRIIHNEETFLVAVKPANLPSHADGNFIKNTFIYLIKKIMAAENYHGPIKLVHRLDRETSGLMLVAKNKDAHRSLVRQFEQGTVKKEYLAVTTGIFTDDSVAVDCAIGSDTKSCISIRRQVVPDGTAGSLSASTGFNVIERLNSYTLVRCIPATGRTNQIRVHLAHIGHPLAGDKLYGRSDEQFLEFVRCARKGMRELLPWMDAPRHMLHASAIAFEHPVTREHISFQCPIPEDMLAFIEKHR